MLAILLARLAARCPTGPYLTVRAALTPAAM